MAFRGLVRESRPVVGAGLHEVLLFNKVLSAGMWTIELCRGLFSWGKAAASGGFSGSAQTPGEMTTQGVRGRATSLHLRGCDLPKVEVFVRQGSASFQFSASVIPASHLSLTVLLGFSEKGGGQDPMTHVPFTQSTTYIRESGERLMKGQTRLFVQHLPFCFERRIHFCRRHQL